MKGDFSRNTFQQRNHFARVLMQQGRVLLDADWNEQTAILLHYLRTLASDLIGPHGGPGEGFRIVCKDYKNDFEISRGHYYVDGILCENDPPRHCPPANEVLPLTYSNQPDLPLREDDGERLENGRSYLVYLDVWERHLNTLQADQIREVALGGPDTATRAQTIWQVKATPIPDEMAEITNCQELINALLVEGRPPCMKARARIETASSDPCIIPPEARYRGAENQLYRIEIHHGGADAGQTTYKWSRDNGSVVFGIRTLQGNRVTLESLGPDKHHGIKDDDWVEIVDDYSVLRSVSRRLLRVKAVDRAGFAVTLEVPEGSDLPVFDENSITHPLLRRWDNRSEAIPLQEGEWITLEDGVQVHFEPGGSYRSGDYWLITARTAIGDVLWAKGKGQDGEIEVEPIALPPDGVNHHRAPLARISINGNGEVSLDADCRCSFSSHCGTNESLSSYGIGGQRPERFPVNEIDGIGETFALRLGAAGITDATDLLHHDPEELGRILAPPGGRPLARERIDKIIESATRYIEKTGTE